MDLNTRKKALRRLFAERCEAVPDLKRFVDAVTPALAASPDNFWQCEAAFRDLLQSDFLTQLTNHELAKFLDSSIYVPLMSFSSQVILLEDEHFQLNVGFINRKTAPRTGRLQSLASNVMFSFAATPMQVAEYVQPEPFPCDIFRRDAVLTQKGTRTVGIGEIVKLRAGYDVLDFLPAAGATSIIVNFSSTKRIDFSWEYSADSLSPVRFVPGDPAWSRIDYAIQIMSAVGDPDDLPQLIALCKHPAHFVRWQAIKAVTRLDFDAGMRALEDAATDQHPHVRDAAKRTLQNYSAALAAV